MKKIIVCLLIMLTICGCSKSEDKYDKMINTAIKFVQNEEELKDYNIDVTCTTIADDQCKDENGLVWIKDNQQEYDYIITLGHFKAEDYEDQQYIEILFDSNHQTVVAYRVNPTEILDE